MSTDSTPDALPMATTSFPRFSSLPPEIRRIIWESAASPRIVHLEFVWEEKHTCSRVWSETSVDGPESIGFFDLDHEPEEICLSIGPYPPWGLRTRSIPPLFSVCRESYLVAKEKIYTKSFGTEYRIPTTWFNFELDTLYLDWGYYVNSDGDVNFDFFPEDFGEDVKKVQNLAIHSGEYPGGILTSEWINAVLGYFGNVRNLTLVPPRQEDDDCADLVFLEWSDIIDNPAYQRFPPEEELHPVLWEVFPDLEREHELWSTSGWLWNQTPFDWFALLRNTIDHGLSKWPKPVLYCKPVMSPQTKLDFLRHKQKYDTDRDAQRVELTLAAEGLNSLEVSVSLLTTVADLVVMFCQARGIDSEKIGEDDVDIHWGIRDLPPGSDEKIWIESPLFWFFPFEHQPPRLDLFFRHEEPKFLVPLLCS